MIGWHTSNCIIRVLLSKKGFRTVGGFGYYFSGQAQCVRNHAENHSFKNMQEVWDGSSTFLNRPPSKSELNCNETTK